MKVLAHIILKVLHLLGNGLAGFQATGGRKQQACAGADTDTYQKAHGMCHGVMLLAANGTIEALDPAHAAIEAARGMVG